MALIVRHAMGVEDVESGTIALFGVRVAGQELLGPADGVVGEDGLCGGRGAEGPLEDAPRP